VLLICRGLYYYLRQRRRLCFWFGTSVCLSVCLFVCLSIGLLTNLWTDFDEIFCRGTAWLKDQVIQFWWRSGLRFGSGSPKSKIRILRIAVFGGSLCSLSTSSYQVWRKSDHLAKFVRKNIIVIHTAVESVLYIKILCRWMWWQADDRMALVGKDDIDVELGNFTERNTHLPPQW